MASLALPPPPTQNTLPSIAPAPPSNSNTNTANTITAKEPTTNATASSSKQSQIAAHRRRSSVNPNTLPAATASTTALQRSPSPDEDDDEADDEDDDGPQRKGRKGKKGKSSTAAGGGTGVVAGGIGPDGKVDYKYQSEIAAMDPSPETTKLVEDIVRGQIIEIVTRARLLTHLRSSRYLTPEDVIFLIRDDRGKVNRLRTYLSWKDVRKKAKENDNSVDADVDIDLDDADKSTAKRKSMVKLPWELFTPFSDFLRTLPSSQNQDDDEEEDEDELQAHQESMQRLRDADEITKKMTKDEYVHYSDCRQASFTFRKSRRFREFINFSAYLDVRPNDDIIDILGFLSFEMVRSLCVSALEVRDRHEPIAPASRPGFSHTLSSKHTNEATHEVKRKSTLIDDSTNQSPMKKSKLENSSENENQNQQTQPHSHLKRHSSTTNIHLPNTTTTSNGAITSSTSTNANTNTSTNAPVPLFAAPPSARQPLLPSHVLEAYASIQRQQAASRVGGMRSFRGGIGRGRMPLI